MLLLSLHFLEWESSLKETHGSDDESEDNEVQNIREVIYRVLIVEDIYDDLGVAPLDSLDIFDRIKNTVTDQINFNNI